MQSVIIFENNKLSVVFTKNAYYFSIIGGASYIKYM